MSMYMSARGKFSVITNPLFEVGYYTGKDNCFLFYTPVHLFPWGDKIIMLSPTCHDASGRSTIWV